MSAGLGHRSNPLFSSVECWIFVKKWIYVILVKFFILINGTPIGFFQNLLGKSFIEVLLMLSPFGIVVNGAFLFEI